MATVFVASLHGSTRAILSENMPFHNYRHRSKQNTARLSFASRFEPLHGRRAPRKQTGTDGSQAYVLHTHAENCFSWTKTGSVETYEYVDPGGDQGKAERRQALAAAAVATHTASLSNDLQYVGRRQSLPRSRAKAALVLPATFYTNEKATQLLFSLTQRGVATRRCSCTAASDVARFLAHHEGIAAYP